MKKILVPTDFSELSKVAVLYAAQLATKLNAEVILLSVMETTTSSKALPKWKKMEAEMIAIAKQDAEQLIERIIQETKSKIKISYAYILGFPVAEKIEKFAVDNEMDLIVMGTKGASGIKKIVMGSNTTAVIDNSSIPVISIPGNLAFKIIKNIVYATDLVHLNDEIKTVARFARLFNATVRVLHVLPADSVSKISKNMEAHLIKVGHYQKISYDVLRNDNITEALDTLITDEAVDILTMFTHKLSLYEKLFNKSISRQLAFHAKVALLTFNKTTTQ